MMPPVERPVGFAAGETLVLYITLQQCKLYRSQSDGWLVTYYSTSVSLDSTVL